MTLPARINQLMLKSEVSSTFTTPAPLRRSFCQCEFKDLKPRGVGEESAKERREPKKKVFVKKDVWIDNIFH